MSAACQQLVIVSIREAYITQSNGFSHYHFYHILKEFAMVNIDARSKMDWVFSAEIDGLGSSAAPCSR